MRVLRTSRAWCWRAHRTPKIAPQAVQRLTHTPAPRPPLSSACLSFHVQYRPCRTRDSAQYRQRDSSGSQYRLPASSGRAALDYHEYAQVLRHASWQALIDSQKPDPARLFALTTQGAGSVYDARFQPGDWLVFGAETRGLSPEVRDAFALTQRLKLPMLAGQRSLNLSNAVAVTVFEAWRQNGFSCAASIGPSPPASFA